MERLRECCLPDVLIIWSKRVWCTILKSRGSVWLPSEYVPLNQHQQFKLSDHCHISIHHSVIWSYGTETSLSAHHVLANYWALIYNNFHYQHLVLCHLCLGNLCACPGTSSMLWEYLPPLRYVFQIPTTLFLHSLLLASTLKLFPRVFDTFTMIISSWLFTLITSLIILCISIRSSLCLLYLKALQSPLVTQKFRHR